MNKVIYQRNAILVTTREPLEGEQAGVDYHYITDEEFQAISDNGGFVEYGQYQKILYGTTVDAVRDVIDKHKICVLNLHAEVYNKCVYRPQRCGNAYLFSDSLSTLFALPTLAII